MTNPQIAQIELTIEEAKEHIQKMNALIKLSNNANYKKIFLEGFFEDYAIQQVMLKSDPSQQRAEDQETIINNINSIGSLRMHLHGIMQQGRVAEAALAEYETTREELLEEDAA